LITNGAGEGNRTLVSKVVQSGVNNAHYALDICLAAQSSRKADPRRKFSMPETSIKTGDGAYLLPPNQIAPRLIDPVNSPTASIDSADSRTQNHASYGKVTTP
jgi:hypothetical protein